MPRYMVQRTFPEGLHIPVTNGGAAVCAGVVEQNAEEGVTWVHSYVSADKHATFCVYDAPARKPCARQPRATSCPSTRSPRCGCSIRTSTPRRADNQRSCVSAATS